VPLIAPRYRGELRAERVVVAISHHGPTVGWSEGHWALVAIEQSVLLIGLAAGRDRPCGALVSTIRCFGFTFRWSGPQRRISTSPRRWRRGDKPGRSFHR
jgi:hypothetical protein